MDTLGKFKTNFLKDRSSFKIGFNNRSPLSNLKGGLDGGIKSASSINIPKLKSTITKDGGSILVPDDGRLEASEAIGTAIGEAGKKIGEAIQKKVEGKNKKLQLEKDVKNLPEIYAKWKKDNPADGDDERFKEKYYDAINEYIKRYKNNDYKNTPDKFDKH
jgi:hypothetical protein|tara:strand:+ start:2564 stop:3046 length:483 start_codon:yes stop_codon:yes gene_type:complete